MSTPSTPVTPIPITSCSLKEALDELKSLFAPVIEYCAYKMAEIEKQQLHAAKCKWINTSNVLNSSSFRTAREKFEELNKRIAEQGSTVAAYQSATVEWNQYYDAETERTEKAMHDARLAEWKNEYNRTVDRKSITETDIKAASEWDNLISNETIGWIRNRKIEAAVAAFRRTPIVAPENPQPIAVNGLDNSQTRLVYHGVVVNQ
jgi:hypothetical protein